MTPGNTVLLIAVSVAWVYLRLKDKSQGSGAYAPNQPYSRMSDAIALFGLFWLSFVPLGLFATLALSLSGGNLILLALSGAAIIWFGYTMFNVTRRAPKAPFLDKIRNIDFASLKKEADTKELSPYKKHNR